MPVVKGKKGMQQDMHKFKHGELHSGSKKGPVVKDRKQAIAIAMKQSGMSQYPSTGGAKPRHTSTHRKHAAKMMGTRAHGR